MWVFALFEGPSTVCHEMWVCACLYDFCRLLLAIEMMFWHNLQIKITTETEDTLRTDSTFCGDMAICFI
jgi:hypothetical protein